MSATKTEPVVRRNEANPEPVEIIASAIIEIAASMRRINESRLSRPAIVALLHDSSGLPKRTINNVLDHLSYLEKQWIKPGAKAK